MKTLIQSIPDDAYKFGCGRYLQSAGAINMIGGEAKALHTNKAFVIGGPHTLPLGHDIIAHSLKNSGCDTVFICYDSLCCEENAMKLANECKNLKCDLVVGIGGGRIMDIAKLVANLAEISIINVPTSTATCAAYTPLSVIYSPTGQCKSSWYFQKEVNCVICDTEIIKAQPLRLAAAGIMDSIAKDIEVHYHLCHIQRYYAEHYILDAQSKLLRTMLENISRNITNDIDENDLAFLTIPLTGYISGVARGKCQSALGHAFYEAVRTQWPKDSQKALHGEIVALGLYLQEICLGHLETANNIMQWISLLHMPKSLTDIGIDTSKEELSQFTKLHFFKPYELNISQHQLITEILKIM